MQKTISRREFLKFGSSSLAAAILGTSPLTKQFMKPASDSPLNADILITIFLRGGMDGLNVIIPQFEDQYFTQRPTIAIPESSKSDNKSAINLDNQFGMHPALNPLMEIWEENKLAIIHAVGSPDPSHSHFDAQSYMEHGSPGDKTVSTGWVGRYLASEITENTSPFRAIGLNGTLPASMRGKVPATTLQTISEFKLHAEAPRIPQMEYVLSALYNSSSGLKLPAQITLEAIDTLSGINTESYTPAHNAQYPETGFGTALLQVAQLIKAEVGLEAVAIDLMGFDTHTNENVTLQRLLNEFAKGIQAFYRDTSDFIGRITIVAMSEFGRRVAENGNQGTDHGHGGVMFTIGGGVNGGKVYTDWPGLETENLYGPGDLQVTTDFRNILGELVAKRLDASGNLADIFPDYKPEYFGVYQSHIK